MNEGAAAGETLGVQSNKVLTWSVLGVAAVTGLYATYSYVKRNQEKKKAKKLIES